MSEITMKLRERFCKDFNIPIKIFNDKYFASRLSLYDYHYDCIKKYHRFVELVNRLGGEQKYLEYYSNIKNNAITYLHENEAMSYFSKEEDMSKFCIKNTGFSKKHIYTTNNAGKCFVSLDMKKGNFTALHHYNPEIVANKDTYEEFIAMFTNEPHMIESKYIRQVIFGNVNPRRQTTYEHYLMDKVLTEVLTYVNKEDIANFSTDEIVFCINENEMQDIMEKVYKTVEKSCANNINIRPEFFRLHKIEGTSDGYIKESLTEKKKYTIRCVDSLTMPFVLRCLYEDEIDEKDSVFIYEGKLSKLLEIPEIKIPTLLK